MTALQQTREAGNATWVELVADIASGARELAAAHAAQLQSEVREETRRAQSAGVLMAGGLLIAGLGAVFLMVAIVMALIEALLWPAWAAWLTVGAIGAGIGLAAWAVGRRQWSAVHFLPEQTLQSVRESLSCLANGKK
jgi:uncharacterized membrane protein